MKRHVSTQLPELDVNSGEPNRFLPGWLISLVLHGLMFGVMVVGFDRRGVPEGSGESFHDVGIFTKGDIPGAAQEGQPAAGDAGEVAAVTATASDALLPEQPIDAGPAIPLQLPETTTIGAGPLPTSLPAAVGTRPARSGSRGQVKGSTATGGGSGPRFGRSDGTSFFQIAAQGETFYYVVDCSGSMDENNAMGVARAELMASIERLDSVKRFQILFYDSDLHPMENGRQNIFFATDINRTFARQFINGQQPNSGTMHRPAILAALRAGPDVMYFLTDGDEPELSPRDLKDLREANRHGTQIHVVEFGKGAKLGGMNWLERLAKDNNGTYRYRDVTAFRER